MNNTQYFVRKNISIKLIYLYYATGRNQKYFKFLYLFLEN